MMQNDNWGHRARFGIFIVGAEVVPEAEWWAMCPPGISIHAARVTAAAPWAVWCAERTEVVPADDLVRGSKQLAALCLDAVVVAHSSSSFAGGMGWDAAVVRSLSPLFGDHTRVTTNGLDSLAAFQAVAVRRPFLVLPPWFSDALVARALDYYRGHGCEPAGHWRFDPGPAWHGIAPADLYAHGAALAQAVTPLAEQIKMHCPADADGIFIAGTGFRCVAILDGLERSLGRPVLSANQVSLWHCLKLAGVHAPVAHYGALLCMG